MDTTACVFQRLLVTCLVAAGSAAWSPAGMAWKLEDQLQIATLADAIPSPDGERVAYVVTRAELEPTPGRFRSQLLVAAADGSGARQFTFGDADVSHPRWSPDGAWIAYLAEFPRQQARLMIISASGGGARPLTDDGPAVSAFQWSPTGDAIALLRADDAGTADVDHPVVLDAPVPLTRLWRLDVDARGKPGSLTALTDGSFQIGNDFLQGTFDWSPDGREIAFTRTRSAALDDWISADIAIVDAVTGAIRPFQQSNAAEYAPHYAPDGSRIAFNITVFPPSWIRQSRVGVARTDGGGPKLLAATPDEQPRIVGWISDRTLLVEEPHRTATALWTLPLDGGEPRRFDAGDTVLSAATLNAPATRLAVVAMDSDTPPEVAVSALRRFRPVTVSAANAAAPALPAASTEVIRWASTDDLAIEGLLTLPPGHRAGQRHPLLLLIHGGPAGVFDRSYLGHPRQMLPLAAFAARGYATLRVNPRGSSGYGHAFRAANRNDWGGADYQDLMRGVDHVIDRGVADPQRLGVAGWSYGGYMTAWIVTRNHRFAAAVAGAPVTDLLHISTSSDIVSFVPDYLGGEFWARRELYLARSPLQHADQITTPTLVLHGAADRRVPPGQGVALFRALEKQGLEARMVEYPGAGHVLSEPAQIIDAGREMLAWFERHLPMRESAAGR